MNKTRVGATREDKTLQDKVRQGRTRHNKKLEMLRRNRLMPKGPKCLRSEVLRACMGEVKPSQGRSAKGEKR